MSAFITPVECLLHLSILNWVSPLDGMAPHLPWAILYEVGGGVIKVGAVVVLICVWICVHRWTESHGIYYKGVQVTMSQIATFNRQHD